MADYFTASADPAESSDIDSSVIRAEFTSIATGFTKVAGYTGNGDKFVVINAGATAQTTVTAAAARTLLGLAIGTNVQAWDADLDAIAALAKTDGNIIVGDGSTWVAESGATARTSLGATATGESLFTAASAAAARSTLGLDTANSPQFTGIEVGHATDSTITRTGAGDIAVEGNAIYRAGGTDVPVADGGTGLSTLTTAYGVVCAGTTATGSLQNAGAGNAGQVLTSNGAAALPSFQAAAGITLGTPVALTNQTSVNFGSIPAGTKMIVVNFAGASLSGTSNWLVQLGDSGGIETTGYLGAGSQSTGGDTNYTTGFGITVATAAHVIHGAMVLTLENSSAFTWVAHGTFGMSNTPLAALGGGSKSLSAELTQLTVTTVNGTDQMDAGALNILYFS